MGGTEYFYGEYSGYWTLTCATDNVFPWYLQIEFFNNLLELYLFSMQVIWQEVKERENSIFKKTKHDF